MARIDFHNSTDLSDDVLLGLCSDGLAGWAVRCVSLYVRYSRGADLSGTCFYTDRRIHVNIGRHVVFPYRMGTNLARARTVGRRWYKPLYTIEIASGYELVVFIFMHELYHLLVKRARRNTRQKESMADRFAARFLIDRFGSIVRNERGMMVPREEWDFQDLEGFVAAARGRRAARRPIRRQRGQAVEAASTVEQQGEQLLLFPL